MNFHEEPNLADNLIELNTRKEYKHFSQKNVQKLEQLTCDLKMSTKQISNGKLKNGLQQNAAKQCEQTAPCSTLFDGNRFSGKSTEQSNNNNNNNNK